MNFDQIKNAADQGLTIFWGNSGYQVIVDSLNQYFIKCKFNDYLISLNESDFADFKQSDFYLGE